MSDLVFLSGDLTTLGVIPKPKMLLRPFLAFVPLVSALDRFLNDDLIWVMASEAAGSKGSIACCGKSSRSKRTSELIIFFRGTTVGSSGTVGDLGTILAGVLVGAFSGSLGAMGVANVGGAAVVAVDVVVPA